MPEFKKGDVVQLKSSSPKITIDSVEEYGSGNNSNVRAICIWFDGGERKEGSFSLDTLVIAQD
jgi:uncharacterized protein YodC (DUF2158 family)